MTPIRPIARDNSLGSGPPVMAALQVTDGSPPTRSASVTHSYAALLFYTRGGARMEQQGVWKLGEGDVLLVPAGERHRVLERRPAQYWGLSVHMPCFAADGAASILEPFERVRDGASAVVHIPSARHEYLEMLCRELEDAGRGRGPRASLDTIQKSLLTLVLAEVNRAAGPSESRRTTTGGRTVVDALRFIERNCLRRLTLSDVAEAVGRTPAYVTTLLTQATGRSAGDWILSGRMAEARRLLLHSDERVDLIGERVGYADSTHFIRTFRREHSATPAAWRSARMRGS